MLRIRLLPVWLIGAVSLLATACETAPDYPAEPSITFGGIQRIRINHPRFGAYDSLVVTVNWKDGDGDLGLSQSDTTGVYSRRGGNRYYYNYFIKPFVLRQGRWEAETFSFPFNGRFPPVQPDGNAREEPMRGVLNYSGVKFDTGTYPPGTQLRFEVSIADRALHDSNTITTDPVTLP